MDSTKQRTLYLVANSHLDTQWRWTIEETIRDYLPRTLRECFAAFDSHPSFQLNFEGAFRYMLVREYYPEEFERLRRWVGAGRWHPAGAMLDMADVNTVSAESLIRQILYAQRFFRRELGRACTDLMLPDCFGFHHGLPSIAAHCGLIGFSAQKFIRWGAPATYPFDIGLWQGPDGASIVAAIHPEGYGEGLEAGLDSADRWIERIDAMKRRCGLSVGYKYFGVRGDRGGAPDEESLDNLEAAVAGDGPIRVIGARSDELYRSISAAERERLPVHSGDLLLPTHGTGCLTSQAAMKRWNHDNERLADAAERAAVVADWLGASPYPERRLRAAWVRFLWHQMHDDITGTSIPRAYRFSWNDQVVALNQFADVLESSVGAVARGLDTAVDGIPLVVFNPLAIEREEVAGAEVRIPHAGPDAVPDLFDGDGRRVPCQLRERVGDLFHLTFLARVPATGFAVFDLRTRSASAPAAAAAQAADLVVREDLLENRYLRAEIDADGNLASLFDKLRGREVLRAPVELQMLRDRSARWPAWEILHADIEAPPASVVGSPVARRVIETGPARIAVEVERRAEGSRIVQRLSLGAGEAGRRLEVRCEIDWRSRGRLLKAAFPLAAANPEATYDLGLGVTRRGNNSPASYEVPAQQWVDLSADVGGCGLSVLSDARYGWDKPDDATLRLSLLRSPRTFRRFRHQATQDFGCHRLGYALFPHGGDWGDAGTPHQAAGFNQPLRVFRTRPHPGSLGRSWSFLGCNSAAVSLSALKRREDGGEIVARLHETRGRRAADVALRPAPAIAGCEELDGAEQATSGRIEPTRLDFTPFQIRTLGLRLDPPTTPLTPPTSLPVRLEFDRGVISRQGEAGCDGFDRRGRALPAELLPPHIDSAGIRFELGPRSTAAANAVTCRGQELDLPAGSYPGLFLLAASADGDRNAPFVTDDLSQPLEIQSFTGFVGQWRERFRTWSGWTRPGYVKRAPIAWFGTHRHDRRGRDEPYRFCYLYRYRLVLPEGCRRLRLPDDPRILILALTLASRGHGDTASAGPLYR